MFPNKSVIVILVATLFGSIKCGAISGLHSLAPAVHAVPAPIAYHHAVPYNIPPYSDRVDIHSKVLNIPAVPAVHAVAPAVAHAALPAAVAHAAVPAAYPAAVPAAYAHYGGQVLPHALAYGQHYPAAYPAAYPGAYTGAYPAAYAYGQPAVAAPVWKR